MARIMAPIMPFTAEEIWKHMPPVPGKTESIHLTVFPEPDPSLQDEVLAGKWETLIGVRAEVTKALEKARADKVIGHSLDSAVTVGLSEGLFSVMKAFEDDLRSILIVSRAAVVAGEIPGAYVGQETEGVWVKVEPAGGEKCQRCWVYEDSVGSIDAHPTICKRCSNALAQMEDVDAAT